MSPDLISALSTLKRERSESSPFKTLLEFQTWADQVSALLAFNPSRRSQFKAHVVAAEVSQRIGQDSDAVTSMNSAIGLLNEVLLELQRASQDGSVDSQVARNPSIKSPEKVTLKWLIDHVPATLWIWFAGLLVSALAAGWKAHEAYIAFKVPKQAEQSPAIQAKPLK